MPSKKCPNCSSTAQLATKLCSCGYNFTAKSITNGKSVGDRDEGEEMIATMAEEFKQFKEVQEGFAEKCDNAIADIIATKDSNTKDMSEIKDKVKESIENIKKYFIDQLNELESRVEEKLKARLIEQNSKIKAVQNNYTQLEKRIKDLETQTDSESTSSECDAGEENEEQQGPNPTYAELTRRNTRNNQDRRQTLNNNQEFLILSDSMMKRIDERKLSPNVKTRKIYI